MLTELKKKKKKKLKHNIDTLMHKLVFKQNHQIQPKWREEEKTERKKKQKNKGTHGHLHKQRVCAL